MRIFISLTILALIISGFLLNVHIIRLEHEYEIITKESMALRDTYADVRQWDLSDYFSHSPRIRNYLVCEKYYPYLTNQIKDKKEKSVHFAKEKLRTAEESVHRWISEKLK